jgi:ppGpp synthetase/RelA/SpoT-type nucleotidyltranferase
MMVLDTRQRSAVRAHEMVEEVQGMCGVRVFSAFLIELTRLHLSLLPPTLCLAFIVLV